MNTQKMTLAGLKAHIKELAEKEEQQPFMLFVENGNYFHFEDHADYDHEVGRMLGESIAKSSLCGGARQALLEVGRDCLRVWTQEIA
jgi:hypothetical protein